jgi:hypothetical protein
MTTSWVQPISPEPDPNNEWTADRTVEVQHHAGQVATIRRRRRGPHNPAWEVVLTSGAPLPLIKVKAAPGVTIDHDDSYHGVIPEHVKVGSTVHGTSIRVVPQINDPNDRAASTLDVWVQDRNGHVLFTDPPPVLGQAFASILPSGDDDETLWITATLDHITNGGTVLALPIPLSSEVDPVGYTCLLAKTGMVPTSAWVKEGEWLHCPVTPVDDWAELAMPTQFAPHSRA